MAKPLVPLGAPPAQSLLANGVLSTEWSGFFNQLWQYVKGPFLSTNPLSQDLAPNILFFPNDVATVSYGLPTAFNVGDLITVIGSGGAGWEILQNAGQTVHSPTGSTTTGSGTVSSTDPYDSVVMIGIVKDTDLSIIGGKGTLTLT